jgi:uncharacterized membrane protein YczE
MPLRERLPRRLIQLYLGLIVYGVSISLVIESKLGTMPWDVFHQGIARHTGLSFGTVLVIVGMVVLLLWFPLRQRPGIGTISNVAVIGVTADAVMGWLPAPHALWLRSAFLISAIILNGIASGLYIGARLGAGPRDGLMTGIVRRNPRWSIRLVRTSLEVVVVTTGWLLGGTLGVGTLLYAVTIGPLAQIFIPLFSVRSAVDESVVTLQPVVATASR